MLATRRHLSSSTFSAAGQMTRDRRATLPLEADSQCVALVRRKKASGDSTVAGEHIMGRALHRRH